MQNYFRHLDINIEIVKQVQDDALVEGFDKSYENDSLWEIHLS